MKKNFVKTLTVLLTTSIFITLTGCSSKTSADSYSKLKERGYVTVGLDDTFAPMGFKDANGNIVGFDVDLAAEAFKRIGLSVKFQSIDWSMKETELSSGNIDMIWNGYSITPERQGKVAFTKPYLENKQIIITLADSSINSKADLKGKKVSTQSGSSSLDAINKDSEFVKSISGGTPILFDNYNDAFMDMEAKRSDSLVADEILVRYYMKERGEGKYKILSDNFGTEEYGVGLRKGDTTLLNKINEALDAMKKDGTSSKISMKWFGENIVK
jgi:polar amino acid transport system substrate-binding protein